MSTERIISNITKAIERGTTTIDKAIENIDIDIITYTRLKTDLETYVEIEVLDDVVRGAAIDRIKMFTDNLNESIEVKKLLMKI